MGLSNYLPSSRIAQAGVIPDTANRPASPYEGQMLYQKDTNQVLVYDGSAWVMIADTDTPPGIELLEAGSFTTVSSKSISKFSSTYRNYQLWINITASSANTRLQLVLRSGSTDTSGSDYYGFAKGDLTNLSSTDNYTASGVAYYPLCGIYTTSHESARVDIYAPHESRTTNFTHQAYGLTSTGGNAVYYGGCQHAVASSYDGITIAPATGTITGYYAMYGMRI